MTSASGLRGWLAAALMLSSQALALEPPTKEQVENYRRDGSLPRRVAAAQRFGNHLIVPGRIGNGAAKSEAMTSSVPATGNPRIFALLIEFSDHRATMGSAEIDRALFGIGNSSRYPYESLRSYYLRSSYEILDIGGNTLGWYRTSYPRSTVVETAAGRQDLIFEAISHFDNQGHDFAQYDNDGDGSIDYFVVIYAGPPDDWGDFWWGYYVPWGSDSRTVDGKQLNWYSFQGQGPTPFSPRVVIHETGHALGLPDYYDYDDAAGEEGEGPPGGVGRLDMMASSWGDHNAFSKFLLGWLTPTIINQGTEQLTLRPSDAVPEAALLMHGNPPLDPYGEYFLVQYRRRLGNDTGLQADGLMIWHVDARVHELGGVLYNNSTTEHKLLRLMEADGLEEIERRLDADAGDFYRPGDTFGTDTTPSSHRYDGAPTRLELDTISLVDGSMSFRAGLGSGCAIYCEANAPNTAWPGITARFSSSAELQNCQGEVSFEWLLGDEVHAGTGCSHSYSDHGGHTWSLHTELGDAQCPRQGSVLVCEDGRCWQWRNSRSMTGARAMHATTILSDGRVLVVGGGGPPELYDPESSSWSQTGPISASFVHPRSLPLDDGRVLVVGSSPFDPVNAEIYDPVSDSWSVTGQLAQDRLLHAAVALADGRVLVVGGLWTDQQGEWNNPRYLAELFDPQTETWSAAGSIDEWLVYSGLTLLEDGRVLLTNYYSMMIYSPVTNSWTEIDPPTYDRYQHTAVRLRDGRVMVIGGQFTRRPEFFHPATGSWSSGSPMGEFRMMPTATVLDTGLVLVTGGTDRQGAGSRTVEIYDPSADTWIFLDPMATPRYGHSADLLPDGTVLVAGGTVTQPVDNWDLWSPTSAVERFTLPSTTMPAPRNPISRRRPSPQ
jgi:M6 family metalloprotease-like protein